MNLRKTDFIIIFMVLVTATVARAQKIYSTQKGKLSFYSKTPVEDISADNDKVSAAINLDSREIAVSADMKKFEFPNKLMQEHFNENYMESDKYPKAFFKGKLEEDIDLTKAGKQPVTVNGKLKMHGVEKDCMLKGTMESKDGQLLIETAFDVMLVDYNIKIPTAVFMKIAEKIAVKGQLALDPKK